MVQEVIKYGVYGSDVDGLSYKYPSYITTNLSDAIKYAKSKKDKISWGYPDIYEIKEAIVFEKKVRIDYDKTDL